MTEKYSECLYCGGFVEEMLTPREFRWESRLFVFENVLMGVCTQCREKFLVPEVATSIDRILQAKKKPTKTTQVTVYEYKPNAV
jgi:YgiT-type zinc finger domain-containing protein